MQPLTSQQIEQMIIKKYPVRAKERRCMAEAMEKRYLRNQYRKQLDPVYAKEYEQRINGKQPTNSKTNRAH